MWEISILSEKKKKVCSLDLNGAWRNSASELRIFFCLSLHIYMSLLWSKLTMLGCNRMKVNFVCVHILVTTLLFSAESIYNSRWCSDSPSSATTRSQLRNKRFHLKGFLWMRLSGISAYESGTSRKKSSISTATRRSFCIRPRSAFVCTWWCAARRPSGDTWIKASIEALEQHVTAALAYARQKSSLNCSLVSATGSLQKIRTRVALLYCTAAVTLHRDPRGGEENVCLYLNSATTQWTKSKLKI